MFVGIVLLAVLPLGFNSQMKGYFQTLCLGYGLYAVGNINLLLLLYFVDYEGAKIVVSGLLEFQLYLVF